MNWDEMKKIAGKRTITGRIGIYNCTDTSDYILCKYTRDAEFIAMISNNWVKLEAIVEAAADFVRIGSWADETSPEPLPYTLYRQHLREALEELDK